MGFKDCNKKNQANTDSTQYTDEQKINNTEHFDQTSIRDTCHHACSSFSYVNVIIIVIVLLLIYHFISNMYK